MEKIDKWLEGRPFLDELASVYSAIDGVLSVYSSRAETPADWEAVKSALGKDEPLLKSGFISLRRASNAIKDLSLLHTNESLPKEFTEKCRLLNQALSKAPELADMLIQSSLDEGGKNPFREECADIAAFFMKVSIAAILKPYSAELTDLLDETGWQEGHCPTCGGEPATALLKKTQKGRRRYLVCGSCHTQWYFKRIGCPYCGNTEQKDLEIFESDEEKDMRIDVCESCKGYLKTYIKEGMEEIAVNDWASAHLDAACLEMGYQKHGAALVLE